MPTRVREAKLGVQDARNNAKRRGNGSRGRQSPAMCARARAMCADTTLDLRRHSLSQRLALVPLGQSWPRTRIPRLVAVCGPLFPPMFRDSGALPGRPRRDYPPVFHAASGQPYGRRSPTACGACAPRPGRVPPCQLSVRARGGARPNLGAWNRSGEGRRGLTPLCSSQAVGVETAQF